MTDPTDATTDTTPNPSTAAEARLQRDLKLFGGPEALARVDAYVEAIVDSAPPLTPAQKDKLRMLLKPSFPGGEGQTGSGTDWNRRTALYRYFNVDGVLIYVGVAYDPDVRQKQHMRSSPWWQEAAERKVEWYETRREAESAEASAISEEAPLYNQVFHPVNAPHLRREDAVTIRAKKGPR